TENRTALLHPRRCEELQQNLMFERDIEEMLIVKDGIITCSSKLGVTSKPLAEHITFPEGQALALGNVDSVYDQFLLV
ncbi:EAL domain-containing protein, partial [Vibrio diabolicus]